MKIRVECGSPGDPIAMAKTELFATALWEALTITCEARGETAAFELLRELGYAEGSDGVWRQEMN